MVHHPNGLLSGSNLLGSGSQPHRNINRLCVHCMLILGVFRLRNFFGRCEMMRTRVTLHVLRVSGRPFYLLTTLFT